MQKENHEYLADKSVINEGVSPATYQAVLVNQQFKGPVFSFSSSFNYSNHLNRLIMIKKRKSSSWKKIAFLTIIPVCGLFFWASAEPRYVFADSPTNVSDTLTIVNDPPEKNGAIQIAKNSANSLVIVDGKEYTDGIDKLDTSTIQSIRILKDASAVEVYGEKGKNGVIIIETKKDKLKIKNLPDCLVVVDGKEYTDGIDTLDMSTVKSVSVLKGDSATKVYGEKGTNGVVIIETKKDDKEEVKIRVIK